MSLGTNRWQKIHLAAGRLVESADRRSDIDAFVDSMIGLDALLDPSEKGELSFRVALNFAFLGPLDEREERFYRLKKLQSIRGKVLHAGINFSVGDTEELKAAAASARSCLRDALVRLLTDSELRKDRAKDSKFWMDRVLKAHISVPPIGVAEVFRGTK